MKLLLIEYEPRYLDRIRGYLAGRDFDLIIAKDGDEGLQAYRSSRPDLVVISSVLPKLRTPDVIRGMQALGAVPPILLMMSGYKGRNKRSDAQRVGATSILEKPFSEETFLAELASALGQHPAIEPPRPSSGETGPLLSSEDIFSDIISGIEAEPKPPPPREPVGSDPSIQKRLEQTLSGIIPLRKISSGSRPRFQAPKPEPKAPAPREESSPDLSRVTMRVNVEQAMASLAVQVEPKVGQPKTGSSPAVEKSVGDTLPALKVKPPPEQPASPFAPSRPGELDTAAPERLETPAAGGEASPPSPAPSVVPVLAPAAESARGTFGRYQLLEKIASGGMAEIYKAKMRGEEGFEKIVAIKRILPHMASNEGFINMFVDEAKLAAQLNHNNIIHIYDLGKVDAYHYIAMEYVDGKDLRSILELGREHRHPLPAELALFIAAKIANALDYAHRRLTSDGADLNLVHRDVSPQNILISYEGDIKLCDFGIAKAATKISTTQSGALKGKLQYMSPEQAWGKRLDRRSDVFSLGIVLFEMLAGERLFEGETEMSILERVRDGQVVAPSTKNPEIPRKVDQIVLKALARSPQDRYQNASEMERELHSVLYAYQPTPGPADLAIYLNRLLEGPHDSDENLEAAFSALPEPPQAPPVPSKKGKLVISKKSGEKTLPSSAAAVPPPPAPKPETRREPARPVAAPGEVSAPVVLLPESRRSRVGLFAGIAVASVALVVAAFFLRDRWAGKGVTGAESMRTPVPTIAALPPTAVPASAPAEPLKVVDAKAVEAEAKRLAAEREKALRQAAKQAAQEKPTAVAAAPAISPPPSKPTEPPRVAEKPTELPSAPESTIPETVAPKVAAPPAAEVSTPASPPAIPPPATAPVAEGDLIGPGEGVVEPRLVSLGAFSGLPPQARQIPRSPVDQGIGTPVVMALIDERGVVRDTRLLRPSHYKFVDEAAIRALKNARIEPATKDGVKVKMWKTFAITVPP